MTGRGICPEGTAKPREHAGACYYYLLTQLFPADRYGSGQHLSLWSSGIYSKELMIPYLEQDIAQGKSICQRRPHAFQRNPNLIQLLPGITLFEIGLHHGSDLAIPW